MDEDQKEELNHIAYSYRSWPGTDQAGVVARYNELLAYVEKIIIVGCIKNTDNGEPDGRIPPP